MEAILCSKCFNKENLKIKKDLLGVIEPKEKYKTIKLLSQLWDNNIISYGRRTK